MATSYSTFVAEDIELLGLRLRIERLFTAPLTARQPSTFLEESLQLASELPLETEKAKSELLVTPILNEMRRRNRGFFTYYSGYTLDVDKERGLTGRCDYILTKEPRNLVITAPLLAIVEAKNDNIHDAVPQCAAQLYAAQLFNERKGHPTPTLYGATTTGYDWLFMRLESVTVTVDSDVYQLRALNELLGVLQHVIDLYQ
jgi:hypothetical protein